MVNAGIILGFLVAVVFALCAANPSSNDVQEKNEKTVGEWLMVFRAKSGNDKSVIDAFLSSQGTNEYSAYPGCTSVLGTDDCNGHYRHSVLDKWRTLDVKRVKLELYKDGVTVAYVTFDGEGTDVANWFDRSRVISSSWTDVRDRGNFFGLFGLRNHRVNRRFYINKSFSGCPNDIGWMVVLDNTGVCDYDRDHQHYPVFLYSIHTVSTNFLQYTGQADVMAIYVDAYTV